PGFSPPAGQWSKKDCSLASVAAYNSAMACVTESVELIDSLLKKDTSLANHPQWQEGLDACQGPGDDVMVCAARYIAVANFLDVGLDEDLRYCDLKFDKMEKNIEAHCGGSVASASDSCEGRRSLVAACLGQSKILQDILGAILTNACNE